jgi:HrpA-like RNA helicase
MESSLYIVLTIESQLSFHQSSEVTACCALILTWEFHDLQTEARVQCTFDLRLQKEKKMASDQDLSTSFIPALYKPAALLPIARHKASLLYLVETYPVTIVVGQTGSGKTTQLPQYLDQAGWCEDGKVIAVTQVH